jgi:hypothetical protein
MRVTEQEAAAGALAPARLASLVSSFEQRGLFVLEGVIPHHICEMLAPRMRQVAFGLLWGSFWATFYTKRVSS